MWLRLVKLMKKKIAKIRWKDFRIHHLIVIQGDIDEEFAKKTTNKQGKKIGTYIFKIYKKRMWWIKLYMDGMMRPYGEARKTFTLVVSLPSFQNGGSQSHGGFDISYSIKFPFCTREDLNPPLFRPKFFLLLPLTISLTHVLVFYLLSYTTLS